MGIDCSFENTHDTKKTLVIDPKHPDTLYIGVEGRGIFKSLDGGATWRTSSNGILAYPDQAHPERKCFPDLSGIVIDPTNTERLLLAPGDVSSGYIDWPYAETAGLWESVDGGASWRQLVKDGVNAAGTGALVVDSGDPDTIYYGVNTDPPTFREAPIKSALNTKGPLYKTTDGGQTWQEAETGMLRGLQATALFLNPQNPQELLLLTQAHDHIYGETSITEVFSYEQFGPMRSLDGGATWTALADHLPSPYRAIFEGDVARDFKHVFVRPFLFGDKFPQPADQRSFYSTDGGETFHETPMFLWVARFDPHDASGQHLIGYSPWYAESDIRESRDGGATWQNLGEPEAVATNAVSVSHIVWDPQDPNTVYLSGTQASLWKSRDGGTTWETLLTLDRLP